MSLRIDIEAGTKIPIYRQIVDRVRLAVSTGEAEAGSVLPSVRTLAEQLVVNPNTVAKAYAELGREGFVESRPGKGVFIAPRRDVLSESERRRRLQEALQAFLREATCEGFDEEAIRAAFEAELAQRERRNEGGEA